MLQITLTQFVAAALASSLLATPVSPGEVPEETPEPSGLQQRLEEVLPAQTVKNIPYDTLEAEVRANNAARAYFRILYRGITFFETFCQVADKVFFARPKRECPGIEEPDSHRGAVRDGTAYAVQPLGVLFGNADADGDIISLAYRVKDRAAVTDVQQIGVALEPQDIQRIVLVNMRVGDKGVSGQIIHADILCFRQRVGF